MPKKVESRLAKKELQFKADARRQMELLGIGTYVNLAKLLGVNSQTARRWVQHSSIVRCIKAFRSLAVALSASLTMDKDYYKAAKERLETYKQQVSFTDLMVGEL